MTEEKSLQEELKTEAKKMQMLMKADQESRLRDGTSTIEITGTKSSISVEKELGLRVRSSLDGREPSSSS